MCSCVGESGGGASKTDEYVNIGRENKGKGPKKKNHKNPAKINPKGSISVLSAWKPGGVAG